MRFRFYFLLQDNPASIWYESRSGDDDEPSCPQPRICHHWCMEYDIAICFFRDGCRRWWPPALTTARDVCPIRKRALGVPSARVKFLAPRRAKNRPLFLKKGKLGKNIGFSEDKNATMWIGVCQPSLGESFWWKLPNWNAGYQFLWKSFFFHFCSVCVEIWTHWLYSLE